MSLLGTPRTVKFLVSSTDNRLVIGDVSATIPAIVRRKDVRTEVTRFEYQATKSQRRYFHVESLRDAPGSVFGRAVESCSANAAVGERRQVILDRSAIRGVVDRHISSNRPNPNNGSGLAGTHVREEGSSDVQTPENIRIELFICLFWPRKVESRNQGSEVLQELATYVFSSRAPEIR